MIVGALKEEIEALPDEAQVELARYARRLAEIYCGKKALDDGATVERINRFFAQNPDCMMDFDVADRAAAARIRELTKNDAW